MRFRSCFFLLFAALSPRAAIRLGLNATAQSVAELPTAAPGSPGLFVDFPAGSPDGTELQSTDVPLPTPAEVNFWIQSLEQVPAQGGQQVNTAVDFATRFALLAYSRNDEKQAVGRSFADKQTHENVVIEIRLRGSGHGWHSLFRQAYAVVYLYKVGNDGDGVGVVVSFKGSGTSGKQGISDWWANTKAFGVQLCGGGINLKYGDRKCEESPIVHCGFLEYWEILLDRMHSVSTGPIAEQLKTWTGQTTPPPSLGSLLLTGSFKWVAFVGHSLGGGVAQIAAADLAIKLDSTSEDHRIFLATLGAPRAGGSPFANVLNARVAPYGGLRIWNKGDAVASLGLGVFSSAANPGRTLELQPGGSCWVCFVGRHIRYTIPSTVISGGSLADVVNFGIGRGTESPYRKDLTKFNINEIECRTLDSTC